MTEPAHGQVVMKAQGADDPSLRQAMSAWRVDVELPPRFQADVWRRIRLDQERRAGRWLWLSQTSEWLLGDIRLVAAVPTLALAAGFLLGLWHDNATGKDLKSPFRVAYVESLDPYALAARPLEGP